MKSCLVVLGVVLMCASALGRSEEQSDALPRIMELILRAEGGKAFHECMEETGIKKDELDPESKDYSTASILKMKACLCKKDGVMIEGRKFSVEGLKKVISSVADADKKRLLLMAADNCDKSMTGEAFSSDEEFVIKLDQCLTEERDEHKKNM